MKSLLFERDKFDTVLQIEDRMRISRRGLNESFSTRKYQRYELPSHVFYCLELTKLELHNCFFKPPIEFEGFLNLEDHYLQNVDFGAKLCGNQICLPQLKEVSMYSCINIYNFNIKATKLQSLFVIACPDATLLPLLHSQCLSLFAIDDFVRGERMHLARVLSNFPEIQALFIDGNSLKKYPVIVPTLLTFSSNVRQRLTFTSQFLCAENVPKWLPDPVCNLKHFSFRKIQFGDWINLMESQVDVGPASNHLEVPDCLGYTLTQLQKFILAHSPSLENCYIIPRGASEVQIRLDVAIVLMLFPRSSPKAKIIYLNVHYP
uniref:FBD domain-containing protein n=1 Tax=Lactuca sativa TaxID=4236 RepID=A0A9R1WHH1_LACSA|nr:hypothetical protein LSAT_V11C100032250 [Lactuca sativa]